MNQTGLCGDLCSSLLVIRLKSQVLGMQCPRHVLSRAHVLTQLATLGVSLIARLTCVRQLLCCDVPRPHRPPWKEVALHSPH